MPKKPKPKPAPAAKKKPDKKTTKAPETPKVLGTISAIEMWPLNKIKPYTQNPRIHSKKQIALLARFLKEGPDQPIVVDEKGTILKGHGRRLAAIEAQLTEFPVIVRGGLSPQQKSAIRIQDNQVAALGDWDAKLLGFELSELQSSGFDMPSLGFSDDQIVTFLANLSGDSEGDRAKLLELVNITIEEPQHLVKDGEHYILNGRHHLFIESVVTGWQVWAPYLKDDALFCPYPGVFVPFGEKVEGHSLIMVQSDTYIAGHILDKYEEVFGKNSVAQVPA